MNLTLVMVLQWWSGVEKDFGPILRERYCLMADGFHQKSFQHKNLSLTGDGNRRLTFSRQKSCTVPSIIQVANKRKAHLFSFSDKINFLTIL